MTAARSIGELVAGATRQKATRTFQPVRRNSFNAGERERRIWAPIGSDNRSARRLIAARMKAAEYYDRRNKEDGKRNGPLGHIGLEVLRELYRIVDFKSGRLEPAIATLCQKVKRSRAAVVRALARLKAHGFVDWIRRTEPTDNDGAGPQVRQITNAYCFRVPAAAAAWIKRILGNGPAPDCEVARREADAAEVEAMLDTADTDEQVAFLAGNDGQLSEILKSLGSSLNFKSASSLKGQNPASEEL